MEEKPKAKRRRTAEPKTKKHVSITPEGVAAIQKFADDNDVSFSAAIESLAMIGMGNDPALSLLPIFTSQMHRSIASNFNRIAKLAAFAAIESGQTKDLIKMILLQDLRRDQERYGDEYELHLRVQKESPIRTTYGKMINKARTNNVRKLRSPLEEIDDILNAGEPTNDEQ